MRRLEPRPKEHRRVPIPTELRASLREVLALIRQAKRDPDVVLDFDDAIQVGSVCGGRVGEKMRPYEFTFYPTDDAKRGRWFLTLHHTEIRDIADGIMTEIAMHCCTSADCRSKFREADEHCFFCDYVEDPNLGSFSFPEAATKLIDRGVVGVSSNSTYDEVVGILGPPSETGGDETLPAIGYIGPWIKYRRSDCQLHFAFDVDRRLQRLSIMPADYEPGT